ACRPGCDSQRRYDPPQTTVATVILARVSQGGQLMAARMDWRIWLPAIVASLCFATRALPTATQKPLPESRSIRLPQVYGMQLKPRKQRYELRSADSSARFYVTGGSHEAVTECRQLRGELLLGPKPDEGTLTLRLDLASLHHLSGEDQAISIPDVLGVLGNVELIYHGKMVAIASSDLPVVAQT